MPQHVATLPVLPAPTGLPEDYVALVAGVAHRVRSGAWEQVPGSGGEATGAADGREVELTRSATHIQWRYVGDTAWIDLVPLADIKGEPGADAALPEGGVDGQVLTIVGSAPQWATAPTGNTGTGDGREVELQRSATHIQWRYVGDVTWVDLVPLADITGPAGTGGTGSGFGGDWVQGGSYADGATVQHAGSLWIAEGNNPTGEPGVAAASVDRTVASYGGATPTVYVGSASTTAQRLRFSRAFEPDVVRVRQHATTSDTLTAYFASNATASSTSTVYATSDAFSLAGHVADTDIPITFPAGSTIPADVDLYLVLKGGGSAVGSLRVGPSGTRAGTIAVAPAAGEMWFSNSAENASYALWFRLDERTASAATWSRVGAFVPEVGADGQVLTVVGSVAQWAAAPTGDTGTGDGREVELQRSATHIQWRYVGDTAWIDLVPLADITGPAGADSTGGTSGTYSLASFYRGEWDVDAPAYAVGELVVHDNAVWEATRDDATGEAPGTIPTQGPAQTLGGSSTVGSAFGARGAQELLTPTPGIYDQIRVAVTTTGGSGRVGVTTTKPGASIPWLAYADVTGGGAGYQTVTLNTPVTVEEGDTLWVVWDSATNSYVGSVPGGNGGVTPMGEAAYYGEGFANSIPHTLNIQVLGHGLGVAPVWAKALDLPAELDRGPTTTSVTTGDGAITVPEAFALLSVTYSAAGRLRLYKTAAGRTADAARAATTPYPGGHGLIYEYVATAAEADEEGSLVAIRGAGETGVFYQVEGAATVTLTTKEI